MNKQQFLFSITGLAVDKQAADNGLRHFSGVANSGLPFDYWGGRVVVDFDGIQFKEKLPVLLEHDREQIAGWCALSLTDKGLCVSGSLLNNEYGKKIILAADGGFPWEMSVDCRPDSVEEVKVGVSKKVNGREVTGEVRVLHGVTVREVSFCATGADSHTSATVFSEKIDEKGSLMTLEEALAEIERLKSELEAVKTAKEEEKAALQEQIDALKGEQHQAQVDTALLSAGFKKGDDGKFMRLSDSTYKVLLASDIDSAKALIGDLKPSLPPEYLFRDDGGETDGGKAAVNPLVENAKKRNGV